VSLLSESDLSSPLGQVYGFQGRRQHFSDDTFRIEYDGGMKFSNQLLTASVGVLNRIISL
jgi:hypothetical protein